ncbi:hypothetical protein [Streptomyces sp. NPDC050388]|uniref:hypothetical protein n=1 Tax=Streptomyces sp. NPDC050388 TaxID=3155781 RepID=UPI00344470B1
MTPETTTSDQPTKERPERTGSPAGQLCSLEVWARSAPIRLAGYEDDLAEPHILRSID